MVPRDCFPMDRAGTRMTPRALVYIAPHKAEIQTVRVDETHPGEDVTVETAFSGVSRGTERLVFCGRLPAGEYSRMRAPFQTGEFPYPVRYGYAAAGRVLDGPPELRGRRVFALHPHQSVFRVPREAALPIPDAVPSRRAVLAANMETALNAVWDAGPRPGERVLVMGAGLLGCLVTCLLQKRGDLEIVLSDTVAAREAISRDFNVRFRAPTETKDGDFDLAFHTTASAAGLQSCIDAMGFEGRIVELSWFGDAETPLRLGGAFHSQRLSLISSQVGHVAPSRRAVTSRRDRLAEALAHLDDPRLDALITGEVAFDDLPAALPAILGPAAEGIATVVRYPAEER